MVQAGLEGCDVDLRLVPQQPGAGTATIVIRCRVTGFTPDERVVRARNE